MREDHKVKFLLQNGYADHARTFVAGDASNRKYERLQKDNITTILMDASPDLGEDIQPFMTITTELRKWGFSAPSLVAHDNIHGFLLLEDLGDDLYAKVVSRDPDIENLLYKSAIDVLLDIHIQKPQAKIAPYNSEVILREAGLFNEWYLPDAYKSDYAEEDYLRLVKDACSEVADDHSVLVLRDYHAENLLWLPEREGVQRVGLLDYQDALMGHAAYDLVSLLKDARRDVSAAIAEEMIEYYLSASDCNPETFKAAYAILGAQRNLKILGIFARLCVRDKKSNYLELMPRVWDHLMDDLQHPMLAELKAWVSEHALPPTAEIQQKLRDKCTS